MTRHYEELDSLRGLGAFTVIWCHFLGCLPPDTAQHQWWIWLFKDTPLSVLQAGNEGIVFFFLLSGFVLSLSFIGGKKQPLYLPYLAKRIFRLYPAYLVAVFAAYLVKLFCYNGPIPGYAEFFNHLWQLSGGWNIFVSHLPLITQFKTAHLNPPVWSLVVEMRISLIFPLLVLLFTRFKAKSVALGLLFSILCGYVALHLKAEGSHKVAQSIFRTLSFIGYFQLGIYLADNKNQFIEKVASLSRKSRYGLVLAGTLLYTNDLWLHALTQYVPQVLMLNKPPLTNFLTGLGASIFLIVAISIPSFLSNRVVHFFGTISYSMYLLHTVILNAFVATLHPYLNMWQMWILVFTATVAASAFCFHFVELPSMKLGSTVSKALARRLERSGPKTREPMLTTPE